MLPLQHIKHERTYKSMKTKTFLSFLLVLQFITLSASADVRTKESFDFDWLFSLSDKLEYANPSYIESNDAWESVQLPHDWNIKMQFDSKGNGSAAYLPESVGWYRKHFTIPMSSKSKRVMIMFDGIFHQSDVYLNGHHLGFRPYGFCSIYYDMTPYLNYGSDNVIAVRANCTGERPRWYAGSGIYRHAWIISTKPIHVATYGTYITTPDATEQQATIHISTTIDNESKQSQQVSVEQKIINTEGKTIATTKKASTKIDPNQHGCISQSVVLSSPHLWSVDTPTLYTMITTVKAEGETVDIYKTSFGIRTIQFDKDKGFYINEKHLKLKGLCLHQDNGSMGTAVPDRAYERRLQILKEYGCNAIRCAHNQPSPEVLEMCDKMGFLVIDEANLVFVPDIHYTIGHPGKSALDCIVPGVKKICENKWADADNIGIDGQSWGGYQVAYMITHPEVFKWKAAMAGAPVANMTSAYGGIRWGSGSVRQFQYEHSQSRIGKNLWDGFDLYIENSPLFGIPNIETPLLIMHNDKDEAVPWYQGIELFTAMKRMRKPVWMLQYNGESHNLSQRRNQKDLSIRQSEFFNHLLKGAPIPEWMEKGVPAINKITF